MDSSTSINLDFLQIVFIKLSTSWRKFPLNKNLVLLTEKKGVHSSLFYLTTGRKFSRITQSLLTIAKLMHDQGMHIKNGKIQTQDTTPLQLPILKVTSPKGQRGINQRILAGVKLLSQKTIPLEKKIANPHQPCDIAAMKKRPSKEGQVDPTPNL